MRQGDVVLVWGRDRGLGGYAVQHVLKRRGDPRRRRLLTFQGEAAEALGAEAVIDRSAAAYRFWSDEHTQDEAEWRRLGRDIRSLVGDDPDIVFEHPGRQTMGLPSSSQARSTIVTCAASSLHDRVRQPPPVDQAQDDQVESFRQLQGGVGGQQADCAGACPADLVRVYPLSEVGEAAMQVTEPARG